jgi:hypothetical protein
MKQKSRLILKYRGGLDHQKNFRWAGDNWTGWAAAVYTTVCSAVYCNNTWQSKRAGIKNDAKGKIGSARRGANIKNCTLKIERLRDNFFLI